MLHFYSYNKADKTVSHMPVDAKETAKQYKIEDRDTEKVLCGNHFLNRCYSKDLLPIVEMGFGFEGYNNGCISVLMKEDNYYKAMEYIKSYIQDDIDKKQSDIAVLEEKIRKSENLMEDIEWGFTHTHIKETDAEEEKEYW